jgi:hypothetical protein
MKDNKSEQNKVKATSIFEKLLKFLLSKILKFKFSEFISNFITYLLNKIFTFFKNMPSRFSTTSAKVHPEIKSNDSDGKQTMNPLHHNATNANELSTHASASTASAANSTAQDQLEVNELDNNAGYLPISNVLSIITEKKIIIPEDINKLLKETSFVKIEMLEGVLDITLLNYNLQKVKIDEGTKKTLKDFNKLLLTDPDPNAAKMIENTVATAGNDNLGTVSVPRSIDGGGVKKHYTTYETYKISLDKACKTGDISIVKNLLDGALGEKNGEEILPGFKSFLETYKVPDGVKNDDIKREIVDIKIKIDAENFKEERAVSRNSLP